MIPTRSEWEKFYQVCDEIDIWSLPQTYGDRYVRDGLQYYLVLETEDHSVVSSGQASGLPEIANKITRLHRALQALTGWCPQEGIPEAK